MGNWDKEILLENLVKDGLIKLDRGRVISSIDLMNNPGDYPVYSSSAQKNGYFGSFDLYDFDEELITWSVDGGGYFFYRPKHKFSVTNVSGIMRVMKSEKFDYKFLYYLLVFQHKNQIFDYVDKAHPSVIKKRYFIPEIDLIEQTQIATILSKVDEAISHTEQLIAKFTRIKTGLMHDLFTKGIDEQGNIRSEQTHEFKDSSLGRIPKEWIYMKVERGITKIDAGKSLNCPNIPAGHNQWGIIKVGAINKNGFKEEENKILLNENLVNKEYVIRKNDFLFSRANTAELVGEVCFLEKSYHNLLLSDKSLRIEFNSSILNKKYMFYVFFQPFVRSQIEINSTGTSGSMKNISQQKIREINITVPTKLAEQVVIVNKIERIESFIQTQKNQLSKLHSLKTGLMQDLLSGKVRVRRLVNESTSG